MVKILIVTSNTDIINNEIHTGVWLEEFAIPYSAFESLGFSITIASPKGGISPIDPKSIDSQYSKEAVLLQNTKCLADLNYKKENFDLIFIPGGHGCMFDLPDNKFLAKIIEHFQRENKIVSAVCHGVCGLIGVRNKKDKPYVEGKTITSFTNKEETLLEMVQYMPFLLQTRLEELGANFLYQTPWASYVVEDKNLLTGQNQNSVSELTEKLIKKLN